MFLITKKGEDLTVTGLTPFYAGATVAAAATEWATDHENDPWMPALPDELDIYELKKVEQ